MAYLGKAKKKDLFLVAIELGETVSEDMRVIELKQIIIGSKHYEDEFVKNLLESIMTDRIENEDLEKQTLAREIQLEKEAREREFQILLQNKEIENLQLKLECLRAKQNTFVTLSQMQQFEETNYLIDTGQNSEQIELDREEVNSENKEILPPVNPFSPISPVTQIPSSTFIATQQKSEELAPIISEVRPELLNVVLLDIEEITEPSELEEDFPYMLTDPNVFDFREIVENNKLKERLDEEQIMKLGKVLVKFSTIFSNIPGKTNLVEHNIDLISDKRVQHKPYRMTNRQNEILKAEIERMLKYKIIEPGPSEYTSPMILVETPGRDPRPCIDYRKLNEMTRTEFYPIPNIEQRVETVAADKFITLIDLTKGYWQIPLSPRPRKSLHLLPALAYIGLCACRSGLKTLLIISAK
ncbi:retrovirus-related Pol polyprotein from transposon 412 [Trichonephila clavata]|uniref:Retrovirus-related Pol polyprotein from transposon 412 n=1 Tax=Trichonephila clavata TaxID=2740835 RepID=A0A8X6HFP3_TRICU|nr:retrovirus-related Pol polyprotein from transposon 412 [Trichonephila clavata]